LFFTHGAYIEELECHWVKFHVQYITLLGSRIALATIIGAFNARDVGKCGVKLRVLVDKDLITLGRLLFQINLQNESSFRVLLLIPTVLTDAHQLVLLLMEIHEIGADFAEISRFHDWFYYTSRVLPSSILYAVGTSDPQRPPAAIESDMGERFSGPVKIDRPKKGCQMV